MAAGTDFLIMPAINDQRDKIAQAKILLPAAEANRGKSAG